MIGIFGFLGLILQGTADAAVTVRDIAVSEGRSATIVMDAPLPKGALRLEYLRDIVQLTLTGATLYPAKIENYNSGLVKKLFAYQYAPTVVRVRFSVEDSAERYRGKIKLSVAGKQIDLGFTDVPASVQPKETEKSTAAEKSQRPVEVKSASPSVSAEEEKSLLQKVLNDESPKKQAKESAPKNLTGNLKLPQKEPASPLRAVGMLVFLLGTIGIFVFWLKRKHTKSQTRPQGAFWSNLFPGMKKSAKFIEVIASSPLGPKQNILLVRVQGQKLVLGVTQDRIQLITQLDNDFEGDVLDDPAISESLGNMLGGTMLPKAAPLIDRRQAAAGAAAYPTTAVAVAVPIESRRQLSFRDEIRSKLNESRMR